MKEILIFAFAGFDMICSSSIVLTSYLFIINTILRIHSTQGWHKAFCTCDSHMVAITIFLWHTDLYVPTAQVKLLPGHRQNGICVLHSGDPHVEPTYL